MGTPRQTSESYFNSVFAIVLYGSLSRWTFGLTFDYDANVTVFTKTFGVIFGFLCALQVFGFVTECLYINDTKNPLTGEWDSPPTGGDPRRVRRIRPSRTR